MLILSKISPLLKTAMSPHLYYSNFQPPFTSTLWTIFWQYQNVSKYGLYPVGQKLLFCNNNMLETWSLMKILPPCLWWVYDITQGHIYILKKFLPQAKFSSIGQCHVLKRIFMCTSFLNNQFLIFKCKNLSLPMRWQNNKCLNVEQTKSLMQLFWYLFWQNFKDIVFEGIIINSYLITGSQNWFSDWLLKVIDS